MGQVAVYSEDFEAALEYFNELADTFSQGIYVNDALHWILFLEEHQSDQEALRRYAQARLLLAQRDPHQALTRYRGVLNEHGRSSLASEAVLEIAQILGQLGEYHQAIAAYQELIDAGLAEDIRTRLRSIRSPLDREADRKMLEALSDWVRRSWKGPSLNGHSGEG